MWGWLTASYLYLCGVGLSLALTEERRQATPFGFGLALAWPAAAPVMLGAYLLERAGYRVL